MVEAVAADDSASENDDTSHKDNGAGKAKRNAQANHDTSHAKFIKTIRNNRAHDRADGFTDHNLRQDLGMAKTGSDDPIGRDFEKTVKNSPADRANENLFIAASGHQIFVGVAEIFIDSFAAENGFFVTKSHHANEPVAEGSNGSREPVDTFLAAGDNDQGGDSENDTDTEQGGNANHPGARIWDGAKNQEDKNSDDGLELVGADSNNIAENIHKTRLTGSGTERFEAPGDIAEATETAGRNGVINEVKFEGDTHESPRGNFLSILFGGHEREKHLTAAEIHEKLFGNEEQENKNIGFAEMADGRFDVVEIFIDNVNNQNEGQDGKDGTEGNFEFFRFFTHN